MTIHEPATFATDVLLAVLGGGLAWRLRRRSPPDALATRGWVRALALVATSALVGSAYHALAPEFSTTVARGWWRLTLLLLCVTGAAIDCALLVEFPVQRWGAWARALVALKFAAAAVAVVVYPKFVVAIAVYGLSLLAWGVAAVASRRPWASWMLVALGLSTAGAVVQQMRLAPSPQFNHNDLYHVIQALALGAFYRAARRLSAPRVPPAVG